MIRIKVESGGGRSGSDKIRCGYCLIGLGRVLRHDPIEAAHFRVDLGLVCFVSSTQDIDSSSLLDSL